MSKPVYLYKKTTYCLGDETGPSHFYEVQGPTVVRSELDPETGLACRTEETIEADFVGDDGTLAAVNRYLKDVEHLEQVVEHLELLDARRDHGNQV